VPKIRIAVLASGRGSNLQSIIEESQAGRLDAEIALVASNKADAGALKRAAEAGIATCFIDHRQFKNREDFDREMVAAKPRSIWLSWPASCACSPMSSSKPFPIAS
jgi:phosphoribosylglycinamide formyltransferase-1